MAPLRNALFLALSLSLAASGRDVEKVEIDSQWGGLGTPRSFHLTIHPRRGEADPARVQALVAALASPPLAQPTRENLGLTAAWLRTNARRLLSDHGTQFSNQAANLQQLQLDAFSDTATIDRLLPFVFDSFHTDDYPRVRVRVTFTGGATLLAESRAQCPYMVPWNVTPGGKTYNAAIGPAVAALMPAKATNRARLSGEYFPDELAGAVMDSLERPLAQLDAENRAHDALAALHRRYAILHSEVHSHHNTDYGLPPRDGVPQETNLHVELHRAGLPPNLVTVAVLRQNDGHTEGTQAFLDNIGRYEALLTSTPWLMDYIRSHPQTP